MADISKRIKELKDMRKMTSKELSVLSGVPLGTLNKVLSSSTKSVKTETLKKIASALSVSVASLLGDKTERVERVYKNYGYVKVCAVTPELYLGNVTKNEKEITSEIARLSGKGVNVIVFPEMCLCGYTLGDLIFNETLLKNCEKSLVNILKFSKDYDSLNFVGMPFRVNGRIYNVAVVFCRGEILGFVPKTHLPNYAEFSDSRFFQPGSPHNSTVNFNGKTYPFGSKLIFQNSEMTECKICVEICEDLWVANSPALSHSLNGATIIVNLSASSEVVDKPNKRRNAIKSQSGRCICGYVYANSGIGESSTDLIFSGHNLISENGKILAESELFTNSAIISDIDVSSLEFERSKLFSENTVFDDGYQIIKFSTRIFGQGNSRTYEKSPFLPTDESELNERMEHILNIQAQGLIRRLKQINCQKVVLGLSGGLDSTLAILAICRAFDIMKLPRQNVLAVTMPCFGTTERTKSNAIIMAELLGVSIREVDISKSVKQHFEDIGKELTEVDVTFENAQARERTQVIMDIANQIGGIVIGTGDLSELALGWATYNGDQMSMYGLNGSIPKTVVRALVRYVAKSSDEKLAEVLFDVLDTPVSPELIPSDDDKIEQKTEDIVGPYELHDFFIYYLIRKGFCPSKVYKIAKKTFENDYSAETVYKWLEVFIKRFFAQQFKRSCMPDGVKVGSISFSPRGDWRMPSDASREIWIADLENVKNEII